MLFLIIRLILTLVVTERAAQRRAEAESFRRRQRITGGMFEDGLNSSVPEVYPVGQAPPVPVAQPVRAKHPEVDHSVFAFDGPGSDAAPVVRTPAARRSRSGLLWLLAG